MLTLNDRTFLSPSLKSLNIPLSEFSFANLFLFRKKHNYTIVRIEEEVFIQGNTSDGLEILIPTSIPENTKIKRILKDGYTLYPIPEQWLKVYFKDCLFTANDDDKDYLFTREKIALYPGRDLSSKRNLVAQFEQENLVEIIPLTKALTIDANIVLDSWISSSANLQDDRSECKEALEFFDELSLNGFLFYVEKKPIAFLVTEKLTEDVHIIHFAKGLKEYKGIYPYIYQQFAKNLPSNAWLNFEQDLGLPNLRKAKHSFHPDLYGLKFRVSKAK